MQIILPIQIITNRDLFIKFKFPDDYISGSCNYHSDKKK